MNLPLQAIKRERKPAPLSVLISAARALALFIGLFSFLNVMEGFRNPRLDANLWWVDLGGIPPVAASGLLLVSAMCLIAFAFQPPQSNWRRLLTVITTGLLALATFWDLIRYYKALFDGVIGSWLPVPLSLFMCAALVLIIRFALKPGTNAEYSCNTGLVLAGFALCLVLFPVAQMFFFGHTDYRRPADVAVVFGARAYSDGRPSMALEDRVNTACELYFGGQVKKLIFSGGPGDGSIHETEAMRRVAIKRGVNPLDILTDTEGFNTQATVNNTIPLFNKIGVKKVLVVSQFYHLPRVKLAYARAGWEVYTVPAQQHHFFRYVTREVAAFWVYYLRPMVGPVGTA